MPTCNCDLTVEPTDIQIVPLDSDWTCDEPVVVIPEFVGSWWVLDFPTPD